MSTKSRWEREEAWEARAKTREIRASRADMVLRRCVGVVELVVMIESDLLGFLGVEVEVLS